MENARIRSLREKFSQIMLSLKRLVLDLFSSTPKIVAAVCVILVVIMAVIMIVVLTSVSRNEPVEEPAEPTEEVQIEETEPTLSPMRLSRSLRASPLPWVPSPRMA